MNAIGANGFTTDDTTAGYINPTYWNKQLLAFLEARLVVADKAKVYDDILGQDGSSFKVTVDAAPTAAAAVAETADITVSAFETMAQVTFTPSEYAKAYQLSDKQARRGFISAMENMTDKLGYAMALGRDTAAVTLLTASAGNAVTVNNVAYTALASSDTLSYATIVNGCTAIRQDKLIPKYLVLSPGGFGQLAKAQQFSYVDSSGSSETLRGGQIGRIYGLTVFESTQIAPTANKSKALIIGVDQMGEPCFGIGRKQLPTVRTQRWELGRYTDIVGVEEWDMQMLRTDGICTVGHYE